MLKLTSVFWIVVLFLTKDLYKKVNKVIPTLTVTQSSVSHAFSSPPFGPRDCQLMLFFGRLLMSMSVSMT